VEEFFRVTLRNISRNKAFNIINIAGLIGLASAIFIIRISSARPAMTGSTIGRPIYRLYLDGKMAGEEFKGAWNSPIFCPTFHEEIPEIENYCRFDFADNRLMWADPAQKFLEGHLMYAYSTFFEIFSIRLLEGDPATCLDEPNTILCRIETETVFSEGNLIGKSVIYERRLHPLPGWGGGGCPETSHFTTISSVPTPPMSHRRTSWFKNHMQTYILVTPGADQHELDAKINASLLANIRPELEQFMGLRRRSSPMRRQVRCVYPAVTRNPPGH
jgi:putative ABC transport system permease protein